MKRITKTLIALSAMTVLTATPVMAALPSPQQLQSFEAQHAAIVNAQLNDLIVKANGNPDGPQWSGHRKAVAENIARLNLDNAQKYVQQMQIQVGAKQENERVKLEVLNSLKSLALVNPTYEAMIPAALADYQAAVAETQAARLAVIQAATALGVPVQ